MSSTCGGAAQGFAAPPPALPMQPAAPAPGLPPEASPPLPPFSETPTDHLRRAMHPRRHASFPGGPRRSPCPSRPRYPAACATPASAQPAAHHPGPLGTLCFWPHPAGTRGFGLVAAVHLKRTAGHHLASVHLIAHPAPAAPITPPFPSAPRPVGPLHSPILASPARPATPALGPIAAHRHHRGRSPPPGSLILCCIGLVQHTARLTASVWTPAPLWRRGARHLPLMPTARAHGYRCACGMRLRRL